MKKRIQILAFATAAITTAGCTQQYNGALTFKDRDAQVISQAQRYNAQKSGSREDGLGNRDDATPGALKSAGPLRSTTPSKNDPATSVAAAPGAQFTSPYAAGTRPESDGHVSTAPGSPGKSLSPLGLFGDLPDRTPTTGDSPDNLEQVTFVTEGADFDPEVDPTGKYLVFASTRHRDNADIYLQKIGGTTVIEITNDAAKDIMPTFSPDGTRIAFASDRSGNWDIYLTDINGGKATQITSGPTHDLHPSFSPDGTKMVYCSYGAKSGQWELVVIDVANPAQRQIIGHGLFPQWSPKGDRIVFQRAREKGTRWFSVWTVDYVDGEAKRATEIIAANNAAAITPSWSPDGRHLVFSTVMDPDSTIANSNDKPVLADVWIVALDGSGRANLTNNKFANLQPVWSKTGAIYFVSNRGKDSVENIWSLKPDQALRLGKPSPDNSTVAAPKSEKGGATAAVETKE
jgi:hypothetical protein